LTPRFDLVLRLRMSRAVSL